MAINAPIQGTEGDVMRIAMVRIEEYLTEHNLHGDVRMLLQVHDELVFEIAQARVTEMVPVLQKIMEEAFPSSDARGVPIGTEVKVGRTWGSLESL